MNGGTLNVADVYGLPASNWAMSDPISSGGPNQSMVAPAYSGAATAGLTAGGAAPAFSLLGMVLLLVAARVLVEMGAE